jgi:hypothetical protein
MKKFTLFAALMLMTVLGNAQVDIANGLLAYYPFNGNILDESGNNRNFSGTANYETDRFGNIQKALRLMSSSDIISNQYSLYHDMDSNFTINFWLYNQGPLMASYPMSWGYGWTSANSDDDYFVEYRSNPNSSTTAARARLTLDDLGSGSCNVDYDINDSTFSIAVWQMITIVRTQTSLSLYQDTILVQTVPLAPSCIQNAFLLPGIDLRLGSINSRENVDDFMIHNRELNSEEIAYLYNLTSSWSPTATSTIVEKESAINIFPNPVSEIANIQFETAGTYQVEVIDITGRAIYNNQTATQNLQINTSDWAAGIYAVTISNENGLIERKKIVKQ